LSDITIQIGGDSKEFNQETEDVKKQIGGLTTTTTALGGAFDALKGPVSTALGVIKTGIGAVTETAKYMSAGFGAMGATGVAALTNIVSVGSDFEQTMANVASVTGGGSEAMETLSKAARQMGKDSIFSASQAGDAMYYLAGAGWDTTQIVDGLAGVMSLAGATMSDLSFTSETVVSTLNQFGMAAEESGRVSNVFAAAISKSQLEMGTLADAMKYIGPIAKNLGWSLEETTGALGFLSDMGYKGEMAGTALRGAMTALLNPTDAAKAAFDRMGLSMEQLNPETVSFADIIDLLGQRGMTAGEAMEIFSQRAGPAMVAMVGQGSEALRTLTTEITGTNAATEMLALQTDTVNGKWKLFKSAVEEVWLSLYEHLKPALKTVIDFLTGLVSKIGSWLQTTGGAVAWGTVVGTALSLVASAVLALAGFFPILFAVLIALAPIGLVVVAALGFIAVGIRELMKTASEWGASWVEVGKKIWNTILAVWEISREAFGAIYDIVAAWWQEHLPNLTAAFDQFGSDYESIHEWIMDVTERAWDWIIKYVEGFFTGENSTLDSLGKALELFSKGEWAAGWEEVKKVFADTWTRMMAALKIWWNDWLPKVIESAINAVKPYLGQIMSDLGAAMASALWESFKNGFTKYWWSMFGPTAAWGMWDFFFGGGDTSGNPSSSTTTTLPPDTFGDFTNDYRNGGGGSRSMGRGSMTININMPPGGSRENAQRTAREINRILQLGGALS
jgi:TP901 family phage tail tape measure protein